MGEPRAGLIALWIIAIVAGPIGCTSDMCEDLLDCEAFTTVRGELCANGIDDNNDTRADCADPECEGTYQCISTAPPPGFTGYYRIRTSSYSSQPPAACVDGSSPVTYFAGPSAYGCSPCTCDVLKEASCSPPPAFCWGNSSCSGSGMDLQAYLSGDTCQKPFNTSYLSCLLTSTPSTDNQGSCIPSGSAPIGHPWQIEIHACAPAVGGCPSGEVCWSRTAVASSEQWCILGDGDRTCPSQWPMRVEAFGGASGPPTCSACSCTNACNGGGYQFFTENSCSYFYANLSTTCADFTSLVSDGTWSANAREPTPSCTPSGGVPGEVQGVNPVTFCCQS